MREEEVSEHIVGCKANLFGNNISKGDILVAEVNQKLGMNIYTVLYIRQSTNKNLLYSTGTLFNIL